MISKIEYFLFGVYSLTDQLKAAKKDDVTKIFEKTLNEIYLNPYDLKMSKRVAAFPEQKPKAALYQTDTQTIKIIVKRTGNCKKVQDIYLKILEKWCKYEFATDQRHLWSIFSQNVCDGVFGSSANLEGLKELINKVSFNDDQIENRSCRRDFYELLVYTIKDILAYSWKQFSTTKSRGSGQKTLYIKASLVSKEWSLYETGKGLTFKGDNFYLPVVRKIFIPPNHQNYQEVRSFFDKCFQPFSPIPYSYNKKN